MNQYHFDNGRGVQLIGDNPEVLAGQLWAAAMARSHEFPLLAALASFPAQFTDVNDPTRILRFVSHAPISLVGPIPGAPTAFAICATKVDEENWYVEWVVPQTSAGAGDVWVYDVTVNNHLMREAA